MSRIEQCFKSLAEDGKSALVPFVTAGDPNLELTLDLMHGMVEAGANIIELGVPFSDPMADGPVIQLACERALEHGTSLTDVLALVRDFRKTDSVTPIVLMGYLNPIEAMGYETFADAAVTAGVDGVLTVDLPPEEAEEAQVIFTNAGLDPIFLISPTSDEERVRKICAMASGFIYYVALKGVTGSADLDVASVVHSVNEIRNVTDLPIGVGFGVKDSVSAEKVSNVADAVVVGSAIVNRIAENLDDKQKIITEISSLLAEMREAMDNGEAE